ncbi:hypothetical protein [[Phormidium] sp. ETS-05]|uniref:hypothetical protein n=1 Tax=[Phormidium] sp. ETS-05 TaxID=222819 RepID=UPI0018EF0694|nr:hypothetical protein [[Phormidium] sp. ETS-05]
MNVKNQMHQLLSEISEELDNFPDRALEPLLSALKPLYYDIYMLRAVRQAQETLQPGDTLTRDEAIQFLAFM